MSRFILIFCIAVTGLVLLLFSYYDINLFAYKDTKVVERVVISSKKENLSEQYPVFPENLAKDEKLEHKEGLYGNGSYGINVIKDHFQAKEDPKTASVDHSFTLHTVGKFPADDSNEVPANPAPPVTRQYNAETNPPVGTHVTSPQNYTQMEEVNLPHFTPLFNNSEEIVVGTFCLDRYHIGHLWHKEILNDILYVFGQFDLIALQGLYMTNTDLLERFVYELKLRTGRQYGYTVEFPTNPSYEQPVPVFLYDKNSLEVLPNTTALIGRVNQPFVYPPLSTRFRAKGANPESAFTFYAVNVHLFRNSEQQEIKNIPSIIRLLREIQKPGSYEWEDDVLVMGYFGLKPDETIVGDERFNKTIKWVNTLCATNTGTGGFYICENILFEKKPLTEYKGSGLWYLKKHVHNPNNIPFNHNPVWANFSIYEGGKN